MLVSIVVPIYNAEKYLNKCLDSILVQSYPNFELLLINDGSTDGSSGICQAYVDKDKRVKLFNVKNGGVSKARNLGIKEAEGSYICFIDSDDWVETNYLKDYLDSVTGTDRLLVQDLIKYLPKSVENFSHNYNNEILNVNTDFQKFLSNDKYTYGYPFNKFYSLEIIKNKKILFPEHMKFAEDEIFYFEYIKNIKEIHFLKKANYHYIFNETSLSRSPKFENYYNYIKEAYHYIEKFNDNTINDPLFLEQYKDFRYNQMFLYSLRNVLYNEKSSKKRIENLELLSKLPENFLDRIQGKTFLQKMDIFLFKKHYFSLLDKIVSIKNNSYN